ncbi:ATP-binding cassette domain-containing protein, partial [Mesorhizobium sp. M4B.F.Ca.ET.200.01.1.1]|uniref:ATP-binding cassette domain-containing protein n=1 Tax=Mesorhizobium sp. M4B.F.Ca.ET.200.01.1.1 TaxID=2563952 RepID=UPI0010919219
LTSGSVAFEGKALDRSAAYDRARSGIAFVPQGREVFPLLTVRENLETGFAPLKRADRNIPAHVFELFPVLKQMLGRRGGDLAGGQQQQLAIGRALVMRP